MFIPNKSAMRRVEISKREVVLAPRDPISLTRTSALSPKEIVEEERIDFTSLKLGTHETIRSMTRAVTPVINQERPLVKTFLNTRAIMVCLCGTYRFYFSFKASSIRDLTTEERAPLTENFFPLGAITTLYGVPVPPEARASW